MALDPGLGREVEDTVGGVEQLADALAESAVALEGAASRTARAWPRDAAVRLELLEAPAAAFAAAGAPPRVTALDSEEVAHRDGGGVAGDLLAHAAPALLAEAARQLAVRHELGDCGRKCLRALARDHAAGDPVLHDLRLDRVGRDDRQAAGERLEEHDAEAVAIAVRGDSARQAEHR